MSIFKKKNKVLVKGPWEGVKEMDPSSLGVTSADVDKDGFVYAFCYFDDGKPRYSTLKKELWDKWEEVLLIMADKNLTEEQRQQTLIDLAK